ncbi:MAG: 3-hydroxyacyl-CoA dehydrogenase NAD-binding domain-containing protein [Negativicutes bacterium]
MIRSVAIVGAGTMGNGIAQVCAQGGIDVYLIDPVAAALSKAEANMVRNIQKLIDNGLLTASVTDVMERVIFSENIDTAASVDMVIEAIPEKFQLKQQLFQKLEQLCKPQAILASNTSGIPITQIANTIQTSERVIGTHFYMPAHLIPLVEVIQTATTSERVIAETMNFLAQIGKMPVRVRKDIPGFIGNRLQHALAREAMSLLEQGVASAEDIDLVVKASLALRLVFTGPVEQRDFNGLDIHLAIAEYLYPELENTTEPLEILKNKVAANELGIKTGKGFYDWRDKNIPEIQAKKNQELINLLKIIQD